MLSWITVGRRSWGSDPKEAAKNKLFDDPISIFIHLFHRVSVQVMDLGGNRMILTIGGAVKEKERRHSTYGLGKISIKFLQRKKELGLDD